MTWLERADGHRLAVGGVHRILRRRLGAVWLVAASLVVSGLTLVNAPRALAVQSVQLSPEIASRPVGTQGEVFL